MLDQAVMDMQADMVKMRQAAAQVGGTAASMLYLRWAVVPPHSCGACMLAPDDCAMHRLMQRMPGGGSCSTGTQAQPYNRPPLLFACIRCV